MLITMMIFSAGEGGSKLEERNKYTNEELAVWITLIILFVCFAVMAIYVRGTMDKLERLQRTQEEQSIQIQAQVDDLSGAIESVRNEMTEGFADQQQQLDDQKTQIATQKGIQSNTIKAFVRYQKQQADQNEEVKEELKND